MNDFDPSLILNIPPFHEFHCVSMMLLSDFTTYTLFSMRLAVVATAIPSMKIKLWFQQPQFSY